MQQTPGTSSELALAALEGLQERSWGGYVLLDRPLTLLNGGLIESAVMYPIKEDQSPEETFIIPLDLGKRAMKGGGVNKFGKFKPTVIVDAYSTAKQVQQEEGADEGESLWRVIGPDKRASEVFRTGMNALRSADALPVNETTAARLGDVRVRNMAAVAAVESMSAIGVDAEVFEEGTPIVKKRNVIIPLGLPAEDVTKRAEETGEAIKQIRGVYTVEQYNTKTGKTRTWMIDIVGVIPTPQPRGTHYTATKHLDGTAATSKKIVTIIDIGGGDIYAYEVDSSSGTVIDWHRLGDGTVAIAQQLVSLVEERYGIPISLAQAQEALYTKKILKGGDEYEINHLLEELKPRFSNLLTTVNITRKMLQTFIIFTGGGVALLHEEIQAKMQAIPGKREEGEDYLIMPVSIAPIANCIGLFAHGYYKVQQIIRNTVETYLAMVERRRELLRYLPTMYNQPAKAKEVSQGQGELTQLQTMIDRHAGQYYKLLQQQILQEQRAAAVR